MAGAAGDGDTADGAATAVPGPGPRPQATARMSSTRATTALRTHARQARRDITGYPGCARSERAGALVEFATPAWGARSPRTAGCGTTVLR